MAMIMRMTQRTRRMRTWAIRVIRCEDVKDSTQLSRGGGLGEGAVHGRENG